MQRADQSFLYPEEEFELSGSRVLVVTFPPFVFEGIIGQVLVFVAMKNKKRHKDKGKDQGSDSDELFSGTRSLQVEIRSCADEYEANHKYDSEGGLHILSE